MVILLDKRSFFHCRKLIEWGKTEFECLNTFSCWPLVSSFFALFRFYPFLVSAPLIDGSLTKLK
ncbi:hypothetical protein B4144_2463 [Bacillus atrophaeus]|nr:hypothetical protein B4144_2463 [Bacillus atrophaeus]